MKKLISLMLLSASYYAVSACPECEKQQPKILRGIVHGGVPGSNWDYIIVWSVAIITAITLFYTIKWIAKPGERQPDHIKYSVLNFE